MTNLNPYRLYTNDLATCRICGTTRPGNCLTNGVCNDDWHGRLEAPADEPLLKEFHAAKKRRTKTK